MYRKIFIRKSVSLMVVVSIFILTACSSTMEADSRKDKEEQAGGQTFVFTGVTALQKDDLLSQAFHLFAEKIEQETNGQIKFEYKGGPETIPPMELGQAVGNGAVDIGVLPAAYYSSAVPEALALSYSELSTKEELEKGSIDYLNKLHNEKLNVQLLGRGAEVNFNLYLKNEISGLEDFKNLRLRGTPTYAPLYKKLGASLISLPGGEIYEALDKGVIDGFGWTAVGIAQLGLEEKIKYRISPNFYRMDVVVIMNLDKWNSLPDELKEAMIKVQREVEDELPIVTAKYQSEEKEKLEHVEVIELGSEFQDIANEAGWEFIRETMPEHSAELERLFRS